MEINEKTKTIAKLNDALRQTFTGGRVMLTEGVNNLGTKDKAELLREVCQFAAFTKDNNPHGEHDFGKIEIDGQSFFWKIDYYNLAMNQHSVDPADPDATIRVLTIMRADEY